tara:strand:+ start:332 stop:1204 length:873 start_codon:yes stop_codon:yes gene_type:complete
MLSILIPCYNFDIHDLVKDLWRQGKLKEIDFEIICIEDGSSEQFLNHKIKNIQYVTYIINKENIGRSKIRNLLAKKAKFNWLLFIDCDSKIATNNFLSNYTEKFNHSNVVFYGKTIYSKKYKKSSTRLHWLYGEKIESKRKKSQFSSHHFLIQKKIFNQVRFDEKIEKYGHEDTIFLIQLKEKKYKTCYIDNPLLHIGLENNEVFIKKTEQAIKNLIILNESYNLNHLKIIKTYNVFSLLFLHHILLFAFQLFKKEMLKNLISKKPNMWLFQFYKLGYYCEKLKAFKKTN